MQMTSQMLQHIEDNAVAVEIEDNDVDQREDI